jgi:hypothetical protein
VKKLPILVALVGCSSLSTFPEKEVRPGAEKKQDAPRPVPEAGCFLKNRLDFPQVPSLP